MKKVRIVVCLVMCFYDLYIHAQIGDIARIEYTILPAINSDFEFNRTRASFNYPIKLNDKQSYLFLGLDYSNINVIFGDNEQPFDEENLDGFQLLDLNIGYTFKINDEWRFGARFQPGISSNLKANNLTSDDVVFSGDLVFIRNKKDSPDVKKPNRLILGISYSQNRGFPFPLPFISYYRKITPKFSYNLGVPKSNFQYHISKKHRLKLFAQLDGFTSNIQSADIVNGEVAERFNMSLILSGLQYEYHIQEHLEFYSKSSFILNRNTTLLNKSNYDIFTIDSSNGFVFEVGIKFKI